MHTFVLHPIDIELVQHAKPKGYKLRVTATLGYSRRELVPSLYYMCVILGQGAQFPNTDREGANLPKHYILGYIEESSYILCPYIKLAPLFFSVAAFLLLY